MTSEITLDRQELQCKKNILIVSNDPHTLVALKKGLKDNFKVSFTGSPDTAIISLTESYADAIIVYIDADLCGSGLLEFSDLCSYAVKTNIPILFLGELDNESDETAAFSLGASDYAVKRKSDCSGLISRLNFCIRINECQRLCSPDWDIPADSLLSPEEVLKGKTLIIAEDVEINQDIISAMLSDIQDLTLEFAFNGMEAIELFKENPHKYSLILMDIHMPVMDGLSSTRAIRSLNNQMARKIPIIALTANTDEDDIAGFMEAGMNGYLKKPMDYGKFIDICADQLM